MFSTHYYYYCHYHCRRSCFLAFRGLHANPKDALAEARR